MKICLFLLLLSMVLYTFYKKCTFYTPLPVTSTSLKMQHCTLVHTLGPEIFAERNFCELTNPPNPSQFGGIYFGDSGKINMSPISPIINVQWSVLIRTNGQNEERRIQLRKSSSLAGTNVGEPIKNYFWREAISFLKEDYIIYSFAQYIYPSSSDEEL